MVGPATDKHQAPTHRLKLYVRAVIESEARPGIFGQTANFGQQPCLFHILNTGIKINYLSK